MVNSKYIIGFVAVIIILISGIAFFTSGTGEEESPYDLMAFTQCLKDKGAVFYGAFWCSHCQATKKLFGSAKNNLPYVECSTPDGQGQLPVCVEKGVTTYPTWIFADGSRLTGELTFDQLAEKTSCPLTLKASSNPS